MNKNPVKEEITKIEKSSIVICQFEYTTPEGVFTYNETEKDKIEIIYNAIDEMDLSEEELVFKTGDISCLVRMITEKDTFTLFSYSNGYVMRTKDNYMGEVKNLSYINTRYDWSNIVNYAIKEATITTSFAH